MRRVTAGLIRFSATNRVLVLALALVALAVAIHSMRTIPVDALPDLSDTQVIVYSRWDRSPDIVEDQVTYPIVTALLGAPRIKTVRGFSDFGFSYVYVIFEDGTDIYWARSRVVEYLSKIQPLLPEGVRTELGPDATGVGWVFQYALVDDSGQHSLADLRTFQDWTLRYRLQSVPGVAEVATFGGFQQQYQVTVDPNRLRAYGLGMMEVTEAVRRANVEVGGRLIEMAGKEYMVRGRGYVRSVADLEKVVDTTDEWIQVRTGIAERRFAARGEATSDIAVPAARQAVESAGRTLGDIDYLILATMTPDCYFPGSAPFLQRKLGLGTIPCLDIRQQCAGFLYALQLADAVIRSGQHQRVLVVGAEVHSCLQPWDRQSWDVAMGDADGPVSKEQYDRNTLFRDRTVLVTGHSRDRRLRCRPAYVGLRLRSVLELPRAGARLRR